METINTDVMDSKIRNIYSLLANNTKKWNVKVKPTPWKKGVSKNSYSFDIENISEEKKLETITTYLEKIFKIDDHNDFKRAIKQVCSGSGNEAEKITILRSSSLTCLLFFYDVEKNPIEIDLGNKVVKFNKAFFEVQNTVIINPSNVDIVLISEDKKNILFLESKFAEYYIDNGLFHISEQYLKHELSKNIYTNDIMKEFNFFIKTDKKNEILKSKDDNGYITFTVDSNKNIKKRCKSYIGGIKQLISHYIGINNFLSKDERIIEKQIENEKESILIPNDAVIYLGEIVFDFPKNTDMDAYLEDYENKYKILAKILKANKNISVIPEILHYSDFNDRLNTTIRQFYYGNN